MHIKNIQTNDELDKSTTENFSVVQIKGNRNATRGGLNIIIIATEVFHDRYIIVDNTTYTMGTSFNSIGKKRFTISKLEDITSEMLLKNIKKDSN